MKYIYCLLLVLLVSNEINAQERKNKFSFGLKVNPFFSWLKTEPAYWNSTIENKGSHFGYSYGIFSEYYFTKNVGLSAELRAAHFRYQYTFRHEMVVDTIPPPETIMGMNRNAELNYIEFPLALKIRSNPKGNFRFYGQFGFAPAINLSAKANDTFFTYSAGDIVENNKNIKKEINKNASSILVGTGLEYQFMPSAALLFGLTYHAGYKNLLDVSYREFDSKISYLAINFGAIF